MGRFRPVDLDVLSQTGHFPLPDDNTCFLKSFARPCVKSVLCLIKQHEYASYKSADIIHMRAARDDSGPYITDLLQSLYVKEALEQD
jgi:hypothetical protein